MTTAESILLARCNSCGAEKKTKLTPKGQLRLPLGWKRRGEALQCRECRGKSVRVAAIAFPVAEVIEGGTWQEFGAAIRDACRRSARLANWGVTRLALAEPALASVDKLGRQPQVYLYGELASYPGLSEWTGAKTSANAVLRRAQQRYTRLRKDVFGSHTAGLPTSRRTNPYPVPGQNWQALWHETTGAAGQVMRQPAVSFPLAGQRWTVRLRGGQDRRRQLEAFARMVSGAASRAELIVNWQPASEGCHRRTGKSREAGGGNRRSSRYMVRLVAELPREERKGTRRGSLEVRTARNCLFVALASGDAEPWLYHADHLRRRVHAYEAQRARLADDTKAERRSPKRQRHRLVGRTQTLALRHQRYSVSEMRRACAYLVGYAVRRRLSELVYDDRERRYVPPFPWHELARMIAEACDREGIQFRHDSPASGEVVDETPGSARGQE